MFPKKGLLPFVSLLLFGAIVAVLFWPKGRDGLDMQATATPRPSVESQIRWNSLTPTAVGDDFQEPPWIPYQVPYDLDEDGLLDILACDARANEIRFIRQSTDGTWHERTLGQPVEGPVRIDFSDIDGDGDTDLLVASMGMVLPNRERIGSVVILENLGNLNFENRVVLSKTDRVTDVRAADFDKDGDQDLVIGQFGYDQGAVRWMEQTGPWTFETRDLLLKSGAIHAIPDDIDQDGDYDIIALISQEWEEVYCFFNDGSGNFKPAIIWGSTNQDYGSSGISLVDLDRDGDNDILYANGDGFDYSTPGPRPWHGVQWLKNRGNGFFERKQVGRMAGAFSPVATDIDGDGDLDVIASSASAEWGSPDAYSLVCFENTGNLNFKKRPIATSPTHLVIIHAADMDGDGYDEIVSGGFHAYPPYNDTSRILIWDTDSQIRAAQGSREQ